MKKIFGYGKSDIAYINTLKRRIFYTLVISTFLLQLFVSQVINLRSISKEYLNGATLIVDIHNEISKEEINNLELDLIKMDELRSVRFIAKSESFKNLQKELNISIPESRNPLYDSFIVILKDASTLTAVQEKLESKKEIKEVYRNDDFVKMMKSKSELLQKIEIFCIAIAFLILLVNMFVFNYGVAIDFLNSCHCENNYKICLNRAKLKGLMPFTSATLVGTLIFLNVYVYSRSYFIPKNLLPNIFSWREMFPFNAIVFAILNAIVWILPITSFRYDEKERIEDIYEDLFED